MSTTVSEITIEGAPRLAALMIRPARSTGSGPAVVLCHGFPSKQRPDTPNRTYQLFAERIADAQGWTVLAVSMRGCGESEGDFSLLGWIDDVRRSVEQVLQDGCRGVWLVGSTTGGSVAMLAAASDARVRGVAAMAPRADFDDWASDPRAFLQHCRDVGVIRSETFPRSASAWNRELKQNKAIDAVTQLADRPLLILHGIADRQVPYEEARHLASRHPSAELRLIDGADHRIRHDPRAIAILLGWLEHQAAAQYA
ncbi:alpha/beta hydrolase [Candidatus Poriferisodalis sp.]|uniref:alpha/beta hydrolase n=1 Tax=Candidatus Poriferisodalis sp. TaxID=3101277 RepID=UPI003B02EA76